MISNEVRSGFPSREYDLTRYYENHVKTTRFGLVAMSLMLATGAHAQSRPKEEMSQTRAVAVRSDNHSDVYHSFVGFFHRLFQNMFSI